MALSSSSRTESLRECYDTLVKTLDSVSVSTSQLEDAIFLDDISLRVKLWGSNIQVDDGCLEWAEKLERLCRPLLNIFLGFTVGCKLFEDARKEQPLLLEALPGQDSASTNTRQDIDTRVFEIKEELLKSVESLATFVPALKAADAVPKSERLVSTKSRINKRHLPKNTNSSWLLLPKPVPEPFNMIGSIVFNTENPVSHLFMPPHTMIPDFDSFVESSTKKDFSLSSITAHSIAFDAAFKSHGLSQSYTQTSSANASPSGFSFVNRQKTEAEAKIQIGTVLGDMPIEQSTKVFAGREFERSSSARLRFSGPAVVNTEYLERVEEYFQLFQQLYEDELRKMLDSSRSYYLVIGVKRVLIDRPGENAKGISSPSSMDGRVFALKYRKITTGIFRRDIKLEEPKKYGLF